ncbi:MAG: outer membrane protein assembly factor BamC [Gammaproteobacteria bacterium]|nr:outer membrane protein assembly factor BamC [Gammaproteobacteria bacterium]
MTSVPLARPGSKDQAGGGPMGRRRWPNGLFLGTLCAIGLSVIGLSGCGSLGDKLDEILPERTTYRSSNRVEPLEIPPDLSSSAVGDQMQVPAGSGRPASATLSNLERARSQPVGLSQGRVLPDVRGVSIERNGEQRWLVVAASAAAVWPRVRDFWLEQGFIIEQEDPTIGVMETDWAEQRDNLKSTMLFGGLFGRFSESFRGVAVRDKFRTRLERGAQPDTTEIYVSHRGAKEVTSRGSGNERDGIGTGSTTYWEPTDGDPDREAEMLARLMVYFGVERDEAVQRVEQASDRPSRATLSADGTELLIEDGFARAWRRTGLALDRIGFTVEDRDRSRGLYYVRYVDPDRDLGQEQRKGFFSRLKFWDDERSNPEENEYLINLDGGQDGSGRTRVSVFGKDGEPARGATAGRILALLHDELR